MEGSAGVERDRWVGHGRAMSTGASVIRVRRNGRRGLRKACRITNQRQRQQKKVGVKSSNWQFSLAHKGRRQRLQRADGGLGLKGHWPTPVSRRIYFYRAHDARALAAPKQLGALETPAMIGVRLLRCDEACPSVQSVLCGFASCSERTLRLCAPGSRAEEGSALQSVGLCTRWLGSTAGLN